MKVFLTTLLALLYFFGIPEAEATEYSAKTLVSALPSKIETIIGANNLTETLPGARKESFNLVCPLLPSPYFENTNNLGSIGFLSFKSVDCFVQGYQFLRPNPMKDLEFNYCAIYLLKPTHAQSVQSNLKKSAKSEIESNIEIWSIRDDTLGLGGAHFCIVNERLLVFATKKSFVVEIYSRLSGKRKNSILKEWSELQDIDLRSHYFAVRHYQKEQNTRYWSDGDLAFVRDEAVVGFSFVSNSLKWEKATVKYYSKKTETFDDYLLSVTRNPVYPTKSSFQFRLISKKEDTRTYELIGNSEDSRGNMYFTLPLILGFVPI